MAKELGVTEVYTVYEELILKVEDVEVLNSIPKNVMNEYHKFIEEKLGKGGCKNPKENTS